MASSSDDDDRKKLLSSSENTCRPRYYGSTVKNAVEEVEDADESYNNEEINQSNRVGAYDQTSTKSDSGSKSGCFSAIHARDSYHRRLLVCNVLQIFLGVVTALVLFLQLHHHYGQCIIGMPIYEGGLLTRGVRRFWCRCPLYTIMLTSTIPWVAIMVNWVSDLFTKKCAFGKWLKWQAILTCVGASGALGAGITSALGFGNWCARVIHSLDDDDMYSNTVTSSSHANRECYAAAVMFDERFHDQFVKLKETFIFALGIMILQILLIFCWAGSCYYSVRMWARLPKDAFLAQMLLPSSLSPMDRASRRGNRERSNQPGTTATPTDSFQVDVALESHLNTL